MKTITSSLNFLTLTVNRLSMKVRQIDIKLHFGISFPESLGLWRDCCCFTRWLNLSCWKFFPYSQYVQKNIPGKSNIFHGWLMFSWVFNTIMCLENHLLHWYTWGQILNQKMRHILKINDKNMCKFVLDSKQWYTVNIFVQLLDSIKTRLSYLEKCRSTFWSELEATTSLLLSLNKVFSCWTIKWKFFMPNTW